ncbi:MAG: cob(I)yrinic acid a,c-diamide adenosyltransferase [Candidatus Omnitrophota bacterium]
MRRLHMKKGYVHVYTGNGKGKTTAALGLTARALGAGLRVYIGQFFKQGDYSEIKFLSNCGHDVTIEQFGGGCSLFSPPTNEDRANAQKGFARVSAILKNGDYDVIILDELNVALHHGVLSVGDVVTALTERNGACEVIVTGRNAPEEIIAIADLVSEIAERKHYFTKGVPARRGIEL